MSLEQLPVNQLLEIFKFAAAGFALILLIISLVAYRRNRSGRLLLLSAAFGVFLLRVLLVEDPAVYSPGISVDVIYLLRLVFDLVMLLLFFLAVVRR